MERFYCCCPTAIIFVVFYQIEEKKIRNMKVSVPINYLKNITSHSVVPLISLIQSPSEKNVSYISISSASKHLEDCVRTVADDDDLVQWKFSW